MVCRPSGVSSRHFPLSPLTPPPPAPHTHNPELVSHVRDVMDSRIFSLSPPESFSPPSYLYFFPPPPFPFFPSSGLFPCIPLFLHLSPLPLPPFLFLLPLPPSLHWTFLLYHVVLSDSTAVFLLLYFIVMIHNLFFKYKCSYLPSVLRVDETCFMR